MAVRDLLQRFRPAGAPGAAAPAGVPSDRAARLSDELLPVLALLADTEQECGRLRRDADERADRARTGAAARAAAMLASARTEADASRAEAAARQRRSSRQLSDDEQRKAEAAVAAVRRAERDHLDALVSRVLDSVRSDLLEAGSAVDEAGR